MNDIPIHIARAGEELGVLPLSEAHALLEAGFLRPTDDFRLEGENEWKPLAQLPAEPKSSGLTRHIHSAGAKIADTTRAIKDRVATESTRLAKATSRITSSAAVTLLNGYLPFLSNQVPAKLKAFRRTAASALRDEEFMKRLFGALYDTLPKPVYRFVTEQQFLEYCSKHRQRLLGATGSTTQ